MIKNLVNPDLDLWCEDIEVVQNTLYLSCDGVIIEIHSNTDKTFSNSQ